VEDEDEESDMPAEAGSFFNFFEIASDPFDVSFTVDIHADYILTIHYRLGQRLPMKSFLPQPIISLAIFLVTNWTRKTKAKMMTMTTMQRRLTWRSQKPKSRGKGKCVISNLHSVHRISIPVLF